MEFKLRAFDLNDIYSLVKHANNIKISSFMTDRFPHPYKREDAEKFIRMFLEKDPQQVFAIEINDEACGAVGVHPMEDVLRLSAEMGYWLSEKYWGNGIGQKAVEQMVKYAFDTFDVKRIFGRVYGNNEASKKVLLNAGFKQEAHFNKTIIKNGEILDEYIFAIRKMN